MDYTLHLGDCLDIMASMPDASIDTIVTDPPYGLAFMGKEWDHGVPGVPFWAEALRVAKPGAMLLAFGGTRTFHRLTCAIEDAGWEIRDCIMWLYGSGFPKSHDIGKAIDKAAGAEREVVGHHQNGSGTANYKVSIARKNVPITAPATPEAAQWDGWGTSLKPAFEPVIVAMKPIDGTFANNALEHGVAGLWIDGARVGTEQRTYHMSGAPGGNGQRLIGGDGRDAINGRNYAQKSKQKPPVTVSGRWPANVIHDGSDEVVAGFPVTTSGTRIMATNERGKRPGGFVNTGADKGAPIPCGPMYADTGSAARFFYCAKASRSERTHNGRIENKHPTVKPLELMRYLCRLTKTPTGGVVLDPFMGSGSTGVAAIMEGREFVGIEQDEASYRTAQERVGLAVADMAFDTLPLLREAAD